MPKILKYSLILMLAIIAFVGLYFGGARFGVNSEAQNALTPRETLQIAQSTQMNSDDINEVIAETRKLLKKPGITEEEIAQIESSLSRSVGVFYRKNLRSIVAKLSAREDTGSGRTAYESLSSKNLRADISRSYAAKLEALLLSSPQIRPEGEEFRALVYIERELKIRGRSTSATGWLDAATKRDMLLAEQGQLVFKSDPAAAPKAGVTPNPKTPPKVYPESLPEAELIAIFDELGYSPWKKSDMLAMRRSIIAEWLSNESRFTRAYLSAKMLFAKTPSASRVYLRNTLKHEKQFASLSCEANSMSHFYNFYVTLANGGVKSKAPPKFSEITEQAAFDLLPKNTKAPEYVQQDGKTLRIWGDPEREFVGEVTGKQSASSSKLTGYGIHAAGVLPTLNQELQKIGYKASISEFSELRVSWNILRGEPLYFWYVLSDSPKEGFAKLEWQTETGDKRIGYIGEHTGIIVGVELDSLGRLTSVGYYEGRSSTITWAPWSEIKRKAEYFNTAITARNI
jgi:hypothetical protein